MRHGIRLPAPARWPGLPGTASLMAVALGLSCGPAMAQTADDQAAAGEAANAADGDIVVTAQFRSQRLQDIPLAITAVNGEMLEAKGAATVLDVANSAPNVTMRSAGGANGGAAQVFIRGVGQSDSQFAYEPGVGMYVDDVYYGTVFGSIFELLDLDRVEVLRGPQGTLSGRNSIGGAVKLFSRKPSNSNEGAVDVSYGNYNQLNLKGSLNLVIVPDRIFMRASAISRSSDGYLTRYDYGCLHPDSGVPSASDGSCVAGTEGGRNYQAGRLALRILPSDSVEVNLIGSVTVDNSEVAAQKLLGITRNGAFPADVDPSIFITGPKERSNYATYINPAFTDPAKYDGVEGAGSHPATALDPHFRLRAHSLSGAVDWTLADNLSLTSITAYQYYRGTNSTDIDLTPYAVNTVSGRYTYKQFTQELRLNGDLFDKLVEYTLGAYYFWAEGRFGGTNYNMPGLANENIYATDDRIPSESKSLFAHLTVNPTDKLSIIGGIRYTHDTKDYYYGRLNPYDPTLTAYTAAGLVDGVEGHYKGSRVDYRVNLQYRWSPDFMTYAQFATGYRAGGVNPRPYVLEQAVPFNPETLQAWEVGFKADILDRAVRINGSLFLNDYKDIIFNNQTPTPNSTLNGTPTNAGDARFKGVELEVNLRPLDGLQIDASGSYLGFKLKRIGAEGVTITGITLDSRAPFAPEWKFNAGFQYEIDLGRHGSLTPRFDLSYQSMMYPQIVNTPGTEIDGYALVNTRLTWTNADRDIEVYGTVTNLFDKYYYLSALRYPVGVISATPAAPRQWVVGIKKRF